MLTVKFYTVNLMGDYDMRDADWDSKKFKGLIKVGQIKGYCHVPLGNRRFRLEAQDQEKARKVFGKWCAAQLAAEIFDELTIIPVPNKTALINQTNDFNTLSLVDRI
jgi:hypothetical protein